MKNKYFFISILFFSCILLLTSDLFACFGVVVGKKASYDGSVLVGHAEQNGHPAFLNFFKVPEIKHDHNSFVKFRGGGLYPETDESYSYLWSENFGMAGSDGILNEWGVMCVSNASHGVEETTEQLLKHEDIKDGGVTIEIRLEIAKRAKTARDAIHIAADIIKRFGYFGSGGTMIIADPNEAWLMTALAGNHWLAERVPDDMVVVMPNVIIQREINLKDTANFLASSDIIDYAIKKGWYDPKSKKPFDFKKAYDAKPDSPFALKNGCDARQWRGQCLVTGKTIDLPLKTDGLPFAVIPNHKITVLDLRQILSDHLEGTDYDLSNKTNQNSQFSSKNTFVCNPPKDISQPILYNNYNYANGSPHKLMLTMEGMVCNKDLEETGIFQLRSWLPVDIGCIYWRTTAAPCSSVLTPWYFGINQTPEVYHKNYSITDNVKYDFHFNPPAGTYDYDPDKAFWIFKSVQNLVDENYGKYIGLVRSTYDEFEQNEINLQNDIENTALSLYKKDKNLSEEFLTDYSNGLALQAIDKAKMLEKKLKTELFGY